ncbi:O-antigen ligase family protein [Novipirellula aureliae]|nr:O-antigen ligase family protein [Novipirellula aureliae]
MKNLTKYLRLLSLWASATLLTLLPFLVALDYAGVLKWTQWAAAAVVLAAALLAIPALTDRENQMGPRYHWFTIFLLVWAGFVWIQTVPLPDSLHSLLSPASADAYSAWATPALGASAVDGFQPISVDPWATKHGLAMVLMAITLAWTSATVFQTRARLAFVMVGLAIGAAVHAGLGIFQLVVPETGILGMDLVDRGRPFAGFVNRNNAALLMNLGIGSSLGLLAWRLSALSGQEVDDENFELNDLISLVSDRESSIALASLVLCSAALLVCGSRGGLVAALFGFVLAFGWIRTRRGVLTIPVLIGVIAIAIAMLLVPLNLDLESIQRFEIFVNRDNTTLLHDGRLPHWSDGMEAAKSYLPLGSGVGTYADAHLPFLDESMDAWFVHADNLWLELFTEQGLVGVLLFLGLVGSLLYSLQQLRESPDAVDHGLRVAGWYVLSALVVSQFFDFGLIVPANFIAFGVFLPIIATRRFFVASYVRDEEEKDFTGHEDEELEGTDSKSPSKIRFQTPGSLAVGIIIATLAILPSFWALKVLNTDAKIDAVVREANFALDAKKPEISELERMASTLEPLAATSGSAEAYQALAELHHRMARYEEVAAANPKSEEEIRRLYSQTAPLVRRLTWLQQPPSVLQDSNQGGDSNSNGSIVDPSLSKHYLDALANAEAALRHRPLSRESRATSIYLDFIHANRDRTYVLLKQLQELYKTNIAATQRIGSLAVDSEELEIASECYRTVLTRNPRFTNRVLRTIESHPQITAAQIVPNTPTNLRLAAQAILSRPDPDKTFLEKAYSGFECDNCKTIAERAKCEELAGDTAYVLGKFDETFEAYQKSLRFKPNDNKLRIKLIGRLRAQGKRDEALAEARKARVLSPEEDRFDVIIKEIAQAELQEYTNP